MHLLAPVLAWPPGSAMHLLVPVPQALCLVEPLQAQQPTKPLRTRPTYERTKTEFGCEPQAPRYANPARC